MTGYAGTVEKQGVVVRQVDGKNVEEPVVLPSAPPHHNEGKTVAGWAFMYIVAIGAMLVAIGMVISSTPLLVSGIGVAVVGAVISLILRALGHGQPRGATSGSEPRG